MRDLFQQSIGLDFYMRPIEWERTGIQIEFDVRIFFLFWRVVMRPTLHSGAVVQYDLTRHPQEPSLHLYIAQLDAGGRMLRRY